MRYLFILLVCFGLQAQTEVDLSDVFGNQLIGDAIGIEPICTENSNFFSGTVDLNGYQVTLNNANLTIVGDVLIYVIVMLPYTIEIIN